jgi:hypothetical protein
LQYKHSALAAEQQWCCETHCHVILILVQALHCNTSIQFLQQSHKGLVKPTVMSSSYAAWQQKHSVLAAIQQGFCEVHFQVIFDASPGAAWPATLQLSG